MNDHLFVMLAVMRMEAMRREVDTRRLWAHASGPARRGNVASLLLVRAGRALERWGQRLGSAHLGDAAVGGAR